MSSWGYRHSAPLRVQLYQYLPQYGARLLLPTATRREALSAAHFLNAIHTLESTPDCACSQSTQRTRLRLDHRTKACFSINRRPGVSEIETRRSNFKGSTDRIGDGIKQKQAGQGLSNPAALTFYRQAYRLQ